MQRRSPWSTPFSGLLGGHGAGGRHSSPGLPPVNLSWRTHLRLAPGSRGARSLGGGIRPTAVAVRGPAPRRRPTAVAVPGPAVAVRGPAVAVRRSAWPWPVRSCPDPGHARRREPILGHSQAGRRRSGGDHAKRRLMRGNDGYGCSSPTSARPPLSLPPPSVPIPAPLDAAHNRRLRSTEPAPPRAL